MNSGTMYKTIGFVVLLHATVVGGTLMIPLCLAMVPLTFEETRKHRAIGPGLLALFVFTAVGAWVSVVGSAFGTVGGKLATAGFLLMFVAVLLDARKPIQEDAWRHPS